MAAKKAKAEPEEKQVEESEGEEKAVEETVKEPEKQEEPKVEEAKEEFKPRYPQFYDGNLEKYYQKVETAYGDSSKEGQRLHGELTDKEKELEVISKIVNSDTNLKKQFTEKLYEGDYKGEIFDEEGQLNKAALAEVVREAVRAEIPTALNQNPALKQISSEKEAEDRESYQKFVNEHPEIESNQTFGKEFEIAFGAQAQLSSQRGEKFDFERTLQKAWTMLGGEPTNKQASNEDAELEGMAKMAQKEAASSGSLNTGGAQKPASKRGLTPDEQRMAQKLGLTDEDYLEGKKLVEEAETNVNL